PFCVIFLSHSFSIGLCCLVDLSLCGFGPFGRLGPAFVFVCFAGELLNWFLLQISITCRF
ncbi:unnamed protein product, partial [Linum tenue]